ncbi:hypothetical protein C2S53_012020, partial [Perilla frutescens var. hirtella]
MPQCLLSVLVGYAMSEETGPVGSGDMIYPGEKDKTAFRDMLNCLNLGCQVCHATSLDAAE